VLGKNANVGGAGSRCGPAPPPPVYPQRTDGPVHILGWGVGWSPDSRLLLSSDDGDPAAALIKLPEFMFPMVPNS
jgi:hypothetical protein